ncbi:MAG: hypothetical protein HQL51_06100 [Magnetococcales bacterium]|nr:hypothetical protein [Magnetococcales bacterium]
MRKISVTAGQAGFLLSVSAAFVLGACGGGGGSGSSSGAATIGGAAVNAPFLPGATVTCGKIETDGTAATTTAAGSITDVNGTYSCTTTWTGPTLVTVSGFYINWASNVVERNLVRAVLNAGSGSNTAYANTMTTVAADSVLEEYKNANTAGSANITAIIASVDNAVIKSLLGADWSLPVGYVLSNLSPLTRDSANSVLEPWTRALLQFDMNLDTQGALAAGNAANTAKGILATLAAGLVGRASLNTDNAATVTAIKARAANMTNLLAAGAYASSGLPTTAASSFAVAAAEYAKLAGTSLTATPYLTVGSDFTASGGSSVPMAVFQPMLAGWDAWNGTNDNFKGATLVKLSYSLLNTSASGTVYFSQAGSGSALQTATSSSDFYVSAQGGSTASGAYNDITGTSFARVYFAPAAADVLKQQTVRITVTNTNTGYAYSTDVPYTALDQERAYPWSSAGVFTTANNMAPLTITLSSAFTQTTSTLASPWTYYVSLPYLVMASPTGAIGKTGAMGADGAANGQIERWVREGLVSYMPLATWTPSSAHTGLGGFLTDDPAWSSTSVNRNEGLTYLGGITWTGDSGDLVALSAASALYFTVPSAKTQVALTPVSGFYNQFMSNNNPAGASPDFGLNVGGYYPGFYSSTSSVTDFTLSVTSGANMHVPDKANIGATMTLSNGVVTFSPTVNFTPSAPIAFLYAVRDSLGRGKINIVNVLVLDNNHKSGSNNASLTISHGIGGS